MVVRVVAPVEGYDVVVFTRGEHPSGSRSCQEGPKPHEDSCSAKDSAAYDSYKGERPSERMKKRALEIVGENLDACWAKWKAHHEHL